jgi:hypothetical protein
LDDDFMTFYQQLIGTLRWCVELGRIDIHLPVALMAQHMAAPRVGHLDQIFHMFGYLKSHERSKLVLDPAYPQVDDSHFIQADWSNLVTRRSHSGIIIFCNRAPIIWYSKCQNTVETSTFGSEFVAARIAVELNKSLRYKLRMFGVPLVGPANMFCDNNGVVVNCTTPESMLKKKHNAIAYHKVREAVAQGTIRIALLIF